MFSSKILCLVTVFAVAVTADEITADEDCEATVYFSRANNYELVKEIDGNKRFSEISLIGAHHAASYVIDDPTIRTQDAQISDQLQAGVRILHFDVKPEGTDFAITLPSKQLSLKFGADILPTIDEFLDKFPDEFVVVYFTQADGVSDTNCGTLNALKTLNTGDRITGKWSVDNLVRDFRGKIIVAGDSSFQGCSYNLNDECLTDAFVPTGTVDDITRKWEAIMMLQDMSSLRQSDCYRQELFLPYNGKDNLKKIALTGGFRTSDGECANPLNTQMAEKFRSTPEAMTFVMADFVTQKLINAVTDENVNSKAKF